MDNTDKTSSKVTLGICAMAKKVNSKDMQMILNGLRPFDEFILVVFTEEIIFNKPVEEWPVVKAMIVFFSGGFPYSKVLEYINLHKPFLINDFEMQKIFWDRRKVLKMLKSNSIPTPNDIVVDRGEEINNDGSQTSIELNTSQDIEKMIRQYKEDYIKETVLNSITDNINAYSIVKSPNSSKKSEDSDEETYHYFVDYEEQQQEKCFEAFVEPDNEFDDLKEYDDFIEYNGKKLNKPFVEKPCNGDDHNIYIYYPVSHGGGHKRLFRKTKDLCSLYFPDENAIRRSKSYIYEEYLQTDGFDIKVYTVGPEYFHAEARKSPTLDGKVQRSKEGKEIRYPINLTPEEKEFARKIVLIFKQNVCGFDILRAKGQSYICDVNGWSFVKGNKKYYEDCVVLIRKLVLQKINMQLYLEKPILLNKTPKYKGMTMPKNKNNLFDEELRSVVAVFRHADRSPKQKMKLVVTEPLLLSLFDKFSDVSTVETEPKEIKLRKPKQLTYVLQIVKNILEIKDIDDTNFSYDTFNLKLYQIKMVLEKNLSFEGMTRKIQLRPLQWEKVPNSSKPKITEALLIMKWGGNITHAGIEQGKLLGNTFRVEMYPSNPGDGDDLLRLHATYRHDLKCYSSEEDRCLETAAAFLQGLLQLEGHVIPIISSMVRKDDVISQFLDVSCTEIEPLRQPVKNDLSNFCNSNESLSQSYYTLLNRPQPKPNERKPIDDLMDQISNFYSKMQHIYGLMEGIITDLKEMLSNEEVELECASYLIQRITSLEARSKDDNLKYKANNKSAKDTHTKLPSQSSSITDTRKHSNSFNNLSNTSIATNKQLVLDCEDEKVVLIFKRYIKLHQDFFNKDTALFDISKIPDIYDNIKYDLLHNKNIINGKANELYQAVNLLANFVMPLEYGIRYKEKVSIGLKIIRPLLDKVRKDLMWWNEDSSSIKQIDTQRLEHIERSYSGLDEDKLNLNEIKKSWRHVKTRFYFTSASHLYSLVNTLVYGFDSFLVNDNNNMHAPLRNVFDLDYCSHIVFRLFENFNVAMSDPKRFRIEIVMSPGSNKDPNEADKNHMLSVSPWVVLNNNLSWGDLAKYFDFCLKEN